MPHFDISAVLVHQTIVLLSLNPGHSDDDAKAHSDAGFREAMVKNPRHQVQYCSFYGLNPKFAWTAGSHAFLRRANRQASAK
jgi:hypothetical protein